MPKRSAEEKIDLYNAKIKKLQEKQFKRNRRRVLILSDSSDSDTKSDTEEVNIEVAQTENDGSLTHVEAENPTPEENEPPVEMLNPTIEDKTAESVPIIDRDLLSALGDPADDAPIYGDKISPLLADRWLPILRKGICSKEAKDKLLKEYKIPENCKLLRAPTLDAEIAAAVTDIAKIRDKKIESSQQQLGVGISAINRAMTTLLTSEDKQNKVQAMKILSDGCRILSDLHYTETKARIKLLTPGLDKAFLNVIQDVERDETLFGSKLSEKIKASKAIEKQGLQIKKGLVNTKSPAPSTSQSQTPTRSRYQGNWAGPARFQSSNRGGRVGPQKSFPTVRKTAPPVPASTRTSSYSKPRAPARQ